MDYKEFLKTKAIVATPTGFDIDKSELNENMFEFQKDLCKWALKKGKSAILIGCGCGKTIIQLEWAHQVHVHTGKSVLILAPLSVVNQTAKVAETLQERREARKESMEDRTDKAASLTNDSDETWLCWVDYNDESAMLSKKCRDSVEVKGSDEPEHKAQASIDFSEKNIHCLVSKPSIFGFGSNFQSCHNMIFCGLSDSYERFYQAVRRCWRFGQTQEVNVYIILSEKEVNILNNIERKQSQMDEMQKEMTALMREVTLSEIKNTTRIVDEYKPRKEMRMPVWV